MSTGNSTDPFVTVICPTCNARLNPRRELLGKRVRCPDCGVGVRVVEGPKATVAAPIPKAGEYSLSEPDRPVEQPKTFLVQCPTCGTRLFPSVDLVGKRVRCPDCQKPVLVPPPPIEREAKPRRPPGEYNVGVKIEPIVMPESTYSKHVEKVEKEKQEKEPEAPPPDLWWLTGVFDFPWREDNISRWVVLAIFAIIAAAFSFSTASAVNSLDNAGAGMQFGTMALMAGSGLVWFLTLAYTSGCVVSIIRSTASGNDKVNDWSEAEIHDTLWNSVILWLPMLTAAAVSYGAYALTRLLAPGWQWWGGVAAFYILFPIMFFSVMEHGSALAVVSFDSLRLIFGHFRGWLLLNLEAGLLVGAVAAPTMFGLKYSNLLTALFGGPIYAALVMILSRLMGRYFFRAHEVTDARRVKKELEAEGNEDDEEDDDEDEEREFDEDFDI